MPHMEQLVAQHSPDSACQIAHIAEVRAAAQEAECTAAAQAAAQEAECTAEVLAADTAVAA